MPKSLVNQQSITEIVEKREEALELVREGVDRLRQADALFAQASLSRLGLFRGLSHSDWSVFDHDNHFPEKRLSEFMQYVRHRLDGGIWRHLIDSARICDLMDRQQESQLMNQLNEAPPQVSLSTAVSTLESLYENRHTTFRRSVVNLFDRLNHKYVSNSMFRINRRMIMASAFGCHGLNLNARQELSDLDRMTKLLQGFKSSSKDNDLAGAVTRTLMEGEARLDTADFHIKVGRFAATF